MDKAYLKMTDDNLFLIFSEAEAPDPLQISLQYFFEKEQHIYKFFNTFTKFTRISDEEMITARCFYNIVKETSLISNKLVIRLHTTSGWTYSFEKAFFRNAERYHRRLNWVGKDNLFHPATDAAKETKSTTLSIKLTNTPCSLPVTQDDTSSIKNLSVADTRDQNNTIRASPGRNSPSSSPVATSANNTTVDISMKSDIREITNTMDNNINQALTDLQNSLQSYTDPIHSKLQQFILDAIENSFNKHTGFSTIKDIDTKPDQITALESDLRIQKEHIHQTEIQYKKAIDKMDGRFHFLTNKMDKFETQLQGKFDILTSQTKQFIDSKKDAVINRMDESMRLLNTKNWSYYF